ncbi:SPFH domain-containing protein [Candidatus Nomurabacteria bacterium]|nr:SPFH domain-containing protein [Candidatus Nomurabacteria bacterium]
MPLPWFFVFMILAILVVIVALICKKVAKTDDGASTAKFVAGVAVAFAIVFLVLSSLTVVGTRRIGVVTSFGRPTDTLSNGIHLKWPWEKVPELDASIQTDTYADEGGGELDGRCTDIRIGNQSTACVDNTIRWRIAEGEGDELYRDYRDMDRIRDSVVTREFNAALNTVLGEFNPLDAVSSENAEGLANLGDLSDDVLTDMRERVAGRIDVLSITIPLIRYDDNTQRRLNEYQAEIANTRIAEQRELTAEAQARANNELSDSVSNAPNVLVSRCFDTLAEMVEARQPVPAGFTCWPGSQSAIVVPSANSGNG